MSNIFKKIFCAVIIFSFIIGAPIAEVRFPDGSVPGSSIAWAASDEHRYARTMLDNDSQKYIYDKYLEAVKAGKSSCKFDTKKYEISEKNFHVASYALQSDYPEYGYSFVLSSVYWWTGTEKNKTVTKVDISYDKTLKSKYKEFQARVKAIVKSIPEDCVTDYSKALYLHDFLCEATIYLDEDTEEEPCKPKQHTAYGPIIYGEAVCEGYAKAYQALLNEAGIKSQTVGGYVLMGEDEGFEQINSYIEHDGKNWSGHAWNVAWLDGECYYIDVTADDPADSEEYNHNRFAKSREEFDKEYLVRIGEKVDKVLDDFQKKLLGECDHESLEYKPDNYTGLTDSLTNDDLEALIKSFGNTYACEDKERSGYTREVYFRYNGEFDAINKWTDIYGYKIFNAIGLRGEFIGHYLYWWEKEPGLYLYKLTGTSTVNEVVPEKLKAPIVAILKNSSKKQIQLKWYEVDGADKYEIYRATSKKGKYKKIKTTSKLSFTNKELKKGKRYYYKIVAVDIDNREIDSEYSVVASAKI